MLISHVYYEDQVIKDGAVLQAQLFAFNSFKLMSKLENLLGRIAKAKYYTDLANKLGNSAVLHFGDNDKKHFVDWIDSNAIKHDHIHLLANELPELFGYASDEQINGATKTIEQNKEIFDKFPSFVSAKIEDYTPSEIGVGGPYDLCAAGRYWCWDAEYKAFKRNGEKLLKQLIQVSDQAKLDNYFMGERYDMNYVYYNVGDDGKRNWHGASLYYEYPNVWLYVFICKYLGVTRGFDTDLILNPLFKNGELR